MTKASTYCRALTLIFLVQMYFDGVIQRLNLRIQITRTISGTIIN